MFANNNNIW